MMAFLDALFNLPAALMPTAVACTRSISAVAMAHVHGVGAVWVLDLRGLPRCIASFPVDLKN